MLAQGTDSLVGKPVGQPPCIEVEVAPTGSFAMILIDHHRRLLTTDPIVVAFIQELRDELAMAHYVCDSGIPTDADLAYALLTTRSAPDGDLLQESL